jgi:glycine/D-amino acid oxidase-like deaminating enzyme
VLVVGAGLTGASLAWLSAERGDTVTLISSDRPASHDTALAPGLVRGVGLEGGFASWQELSEDDAKRAIRRDRRGYELLRELVLASRRPTGFVRCPHLLLASPRATEEEAQRAASRLCELGFPVQPREHGGSPALCREDDALIHPRRLTFEMLRRARSLGADIRLGTVCRDLRPGQPGRAVQAVTSRGELDVDHALWAAGPHVAGRSAPTGEQVRIVLQQTLAPGRAPLEWILEGPRGDILLAPHPSRRGLTILSRVAEENVAGGLEWPEPPPAWDVYRGPAVRQRLSEVVSAAPGTGLTDLSGPVRPLVGLSGWPIAALVGACADAVGVSADTTPKPI